jgi:hypothetical protein
MIAKTLRKQISKRSEDMADIVHKVSGIEKDTLDRSKIIAQLKPTLNNGNRGIKSFTSTCLKQLHQGSGSSSSYAFNVTTSKQDKGNV